MEQTLETAAEAMDYRDPLPTQTFKTPNGTFVYDYTKLTFIQVMAAEELALWKKEQCENVPTEFRQIERSGGMYYVLDMAALLLVPMDGKKRGVYNHDKRSETRTALEQASNPDDYNRLEACIRDFFTRRGKRRLASITLSRSNAAKLLTALMAAQATQTSSSANSASNGSSIPANTSAD